MSSYQKQIADTCTVNKTLSDTCTINKTLSDTCTINKVLADSCPIGVEQFPTYWTDENGSYVLTDNGVRIRID